MAQSDSFSAFSLSAETLRALSDLGYTQPTPIQSEAIQLMLSGYDLIGQSQTGTGKTAAFGLPIIERIETLDRSLQAVVLCPTRELCMQVAGELRKFLKYHASIRVAAVYGGQPIDKQIQSLRGGVQIVVGTPGRFIDHLRRHTLKLKSVQTVVLDEADEMLNMGFREDIETILNGMPEDRQTVCFSATMPEPIMALTAKYLREPKFIHAGEQELAAASVDQVYFTLKEKLKPEALARILEYEHPDSMLVFCNTKRRVDELYQTLKENGITCSALHGDMTQQARDVVMRQFRQHEAHLLIATDVAARGIDVHDIDLVLNYDVPEQDEIYVHRIGRTGRAGKTGKAYTFVVGRDSERLASIMAYTGETIREASLPTLAEIESRRTRDLLDEVRSLIDRNTFTHQLDHYQRITQRLENEGYEASDIAAALFMLKIGTTPEQVDDLNRPQPHPQRRNRQPRRKR